MIYEEVEAYIYGIPKFTNTNPGGYTRIFACKLGINMDKMQNRIIHVAGTNGKGSVCAFMANTLKMSGYRVGLFTSPHLVAMNERIMINGKPVDDDSFIQAFLTVKEVIDELKDEGINHPTFFEILFLMAMYVYQKEEVDYIVLETGLGGRLDATNIFSRPLLTIITSIGLDHMEYLGDTVEKITTEKAGIIKQDVPLVFWDSSENSTRILEETAAKKGIKYIRVSEHDYKIIKKNDKSVDFCSLCGYYLSYVFTVPFISEYQVQNAMLAIRACELLNEKMEMEIPDDTKSDKKTEMDEIIRIEDIQRGIATTVWKGRMEQIEPGVFLDGAHNEPGIREFVKTFNEVGSAGEKILLFAVVRDKDYDSMVELICRTDATTLVITQIDGERCLSAETVRNDFLSHGFTGRVKVCENVKKAYKDILSEKKEKDRVFCVGSLYLIGQIEELYM